MYIKYISLKPTDATRLQRVLHDTQKNKLIPM